MSKLGDYEAVRKDIAAALKKPDYDDGSLGPVFVRLAWYVDSVPLREEESGRPDGQRIHSRPIAVPGSKRGQSLTVDLCSQALLWHI